MKLANVRGLALIAILTTAACSATLPPNELVTARTNYARASEGPAAQLAPADLHTAKESLDRAEISFKNDGDTPETKDIAYAAGRNAELAESRARIVRANQLKDQTNAVQHANEVNQAQVTTAELAKTKGQLALSGQALASEKAQREDADLVSRGIASDRITAIGYGSSRPIADNTSPEGRANNRRVEIVVSPKRP